MIPLLVDVVGDPVGVRGGARRLVAAAESLSGSARVLSDSNLEAVRAWDGASQRMFSLITEGFSEVVSGAAGIASEFAAALDRYAGVLEVCQGEVRMCRQRLDALAAATPVGMVPDQVSVGVLVGQANDAFARALQAARELAVVAVGLMGSSSGSSVVPVGSDANATFVSQAHSVGLAPAHPAAAAFDVQAAHIQSQMNGVMASLAGHTMASSSLYPTSMTIGGSTFDSAISGPVYSGAGVVGGSTFDSAISASEILPGAGVIGGNTFGSSFSAAGVFPGAAVIGGGSYSGNPQMALIEAGENISRRNALSIWNRVMPGVPPPVGGSGAILNELLKNGDRLSPGDLAGIGIINDANNFSIRTQLLPPGWELVRMPRFY